VSGLSAVRPPGLDAVVGPDRDVVLEEAPGEQYDRLLDDVLFRPLGMRAAFVDGTSTPRPPDMVQGHQSFFDLQRHRA
jgi:hypothetical protein